MAAEDPLLSLPAEIAVRRIALRHLDRAAEAAERFRVSEDAEALHDFRVGLRRLRATLRAYRELPGDPAPKKLRRALRRLAGDTTQARETEVQLAWLDHQQRTLRPHERSGHRWLHRHWQAQLLAEYLKLRECIDRDFAAVEQRLRLRLATLENVAPSLPMSVVLAEALGQLLPTFAAALASLAESDDPLRIHPPRLIAKRLRYLIDPFANEIQTAAIAARSLGKLQDLLGDIHDRQVLSPALLRAAEAAGAARFRLMLEIALHRDADPQALAHARRAGESAGLIALAQRAEAEERELLQQLHHWLDTGVSDALLRQIREVQETLGTAQSVPLPLG